MRKIALKKRRQQGFTILELIIVMAIIGILATIAIPALYQHPRRAKEAVLKTNLHTLRDVINQYYADQGKYPPSLEALADEAYLRTVPMDPMTGANDTWELVYEDASDQEIDSDFSDFDTGADVFDSAEPGIWDVYSGSEDLSLDGETHYNEW